jgi:hypothetical protein
MANIDTFVEKVAASTKLQQSLAELVKKTDGNLIDDLVKTAKKEGIQLSESDAKTFAVAAFAGNELKQESGPLSESSLDRVVGGAPSIMQFSVGNRRLQIDRSSVNLTTASDLANRLGNLKLNFGFDRIGRLLCW